MPLSGRTSLIAALLLAGLISGLFFSLIQSLEALPLLRTAERMEHRQLERGLPPHQYHGSTTHSHTSEAAPPQDETGRNGARLMSNGLLGMGYALLLGAAILHHNRRPAANRSHPVTGLVWGIAGYYVFYFAPSLQYPPGTPATDLLRSVHDHGGVFSHQLGWITVALTSAAGLLLAVYTRGTRRLIGLLLIALPQVVLSLVERNWPALQGQGAMIRLYQLNELNYRYATDLGNLIFWLLQGGLSALVVDRFGSEHPAGEPQPEPQSEQRLTTD